MKSKFSLLFFVIFIFSQSFSQLYITNVSVVDVINKKIIAGQTLVVADNKISDIKPTGKIKPAANATIIDGSGKYIMPGMTDAHVHFFQSGGLYTRPDAMDLRKVAPYDKELSWVHNNMEDLLRRYVRAGITSVVDVGASYSFLQQRDSFANKVYAPTIYMTGPLLTSYEPPVFAGLKDEEPFKLFTTAENAKQFVQEQLAYHPDFIKIWFIVSMGGDIEKTARKYEPILKAIVEEAHKNNLKVAVHATERIAAEIAVQNGADFLVHSVEDEVVTDDFIKLLKAKNTVLCPTLVVADGYANTFGQKHHFSLYDLTTANPQQIGSVFDLKHLADTNRINAVKKYFSSDKIIATNLHEDSVRKINLKKMVDAGITIAAGTDAGNTGTQHVSSYMSELKAMQQSGISNWQLLQTATINGAKIFSNENKTGSITVGKNADMILLNANPVDNIDNLTKIAYVINKGVLIKPDTLIKETGLALVQRQLNAYNARNVEAFLEPYSDDVELYNFPDKLISKGKESMRKGYDDLFKKVPELHCEIKARSIQGSYIIDKESVTGFGNRKLEATAIYYISSGKIQKVYFIE